MSSLLMALAGDTDRLARGLCQSVVAIEADGGGGAGIVWPGERLVVTNSHVIAGEDARVLAADGRRFTGRLLARDPRLDLAALRIDGDLPPAALGDSGGVRTGDLVVAAGHPWGQRWALTAGIILSVSGNGGPAPAAIRADLRLAPGNSGGPMADARGRVIGVNTMIAGGVAIASPVAAATSFVEQAVAGRGVLGVVATAVALPRALAAALAAVPAVALMFTDIAGGSPAEAAGLLPGDLLVSVDGVAGEAPALADALGRLRAQRTVRLEVLRGGQRRSLSATPAPAVTEATA